MFLSGRALAQPPARRRRRTDALSLTILSHCLGCLLLLLLLLPLSLLLLSLLLLSLLLLLDGWLDGLDDLLGRARATLMLYTQVTIRNNTKNV
jgi:hypothetical protein